MFVKNDFVTVTKIRKTKKYVLSYSHMGFITRGYSHGTSMATIEVICETTFSTCIRGDHVYQDEWRMPMLDETLLCCHELANVHDPFPIKVMKADTTVGDATLMVISMF